MDEDDESRSDDDVPGEQLAARAKRGDEAAENNAVDQARNLDCLRVAHDPLRVDRMEQKVDKRRSVEHA